jgi:hypothetical protein
MMDIATSPARRLSGALVLCLLIWGARTGASHTQSPAVTMAGYPAPGAPAVVTVLSAGSEPRTRLRYTLARSYKEHLAMSLRLTLSMDMAGMALPPMQMPLMTQGADVSVTDVSAGGDISYAIGFTGFGVERPSGGDPATVALFESMGPALQDLDSAVKGIAAGGTISDRGVSRSVHIDLTKITDPQQRQMMEPVSNTMQSLSTPLPDEAVGAGARWESRQALAAGGMQVFQKTVFELVALEGKTARLKVTMEQTAPPQPLSNPLLPPGTDARLQKHSGTGSGTIALRLDALVPASDMTMQTNTLMELSLGGAVQAASTATALKITVSPVK